MNISAFKNFICTPVSCGRLAQLSAGMFMLFFIASCAGNGEPLTNPEPKSDSPATAAQNYYDYDEPAVSTASARTERLPEGSIGNKGFSFSFPGGDWTMIGGEDGAPYEFYNATTGRRAVLREVSLDDGEPMNLMDRAQMEMQSLEASGKKASLSELNPEETFPKRDSSRKSGRNSSRDSP